jgi:hypothetical protein
MRLVLLLVLLAGCPPPSAPKAHRAESVARQMVEDKLEAPSTAKYQAVRILESEGNYHLLQVVVDAQNKFGVMLRHKLCVVVKFKASDKSNFYFNRENGVQGCEDPPTDEERRLMKSANDWALAPAQDLADRMESGSQASARGLKAIAAGTAIRIEYELAPEEALQRRRMR